MRKRSRHVEQRFFWISDRLKNHSIEIKYCPTSLILAEFFTKPLQGSLFRDMRDIAQGNAEYSLLTGKYDKSTLKENDNIDTEEHNVCVPISDIDRKERVGKYNEEKLTIKANKNEMRLKVENNEREEDERTYADIVRGI